MKDIIYMNEDEVLKLIVESVKTLKSYREAMKKSSEARYNANPMETSRAKMTTLNARHDRNCEAYEREKESLKANITFL